MNTNLRHLCNFRYLEFEEFCQLSAKFLIEEDEEGMKRELKEAFRIYDKAGTCFLINYFVCYTKKYILKVHGTVVLVTLKTSIFRKWIYSRIFVKRNSTRA